MATPEETKKIVDSTINQLKEAGKLSDDLLDKFDSLGGVFQASLNELKNGKFYISEMNKSYKDLSSIASKFKNEQLGYNDLSLKEIKNLKTRTQIQIQQLDNLLKQKDLDIEHQARIEEEIKFAKDLLDAAKKREEFERKIFKNLGITGQAFKGIAKSLDKIGVDSEIIKGMSDKLRDAAEHGKVGFKKLFEVTKEGFKEALEDPLGRAVIGLKLFNSGFNDLKKIFNAFLELDKIIIGTARSLGMSREQIDKFISDGVKGQGQFNDKLNNNTYTAAQLAQSLGEINSQLGLSVKVSEASVNEFTKMTQTMGLTADEASKIYKLGLLNNMSLKDTNKSIASGIVVAQKSTGVQINAKQVFQEIGKLSAGITAKFQQNPEALAKAVVQAKALGTNLEAVDKIGDSLLNWESSIENELKAELITGKQLNLEKARAAALTGDQVTLMQEVANQVGSLADFQNMNVIAQKSLAEAFGMSRDEMADMLQKQEVFSKLGDVSGKSAAEQLKIAKERAISESDSLVVNLQQQASAEKLEATMTNLKNIMADMLSGPLSGLVNMMAFFAKHTGLAYTAITAMAGLSLGKLILGIASMASSLVTAGISAAAVNSALTWGLGSIAVIAAIAGIAGAISSTTDKVQSKENKFASGGIVTGEINNATIGEAGPEAIIPLNSPKASNMLGGDNSGVIAAINALGNRIDALMKQPITIENKMDSAKVGESVGRRAETGTAQYKYNAYSLA